MRSNLKTPRKTKKIPCTTPGCPNIVDRVNATALARCYDCKKKRRDEAHKRHRAKLRAKKKDVDNSLAE